jgi:hypothetical protein
MNKFIPLPKSQSNNRVIHEYQSTNRRFTLIIIIAMKGGTHSHTTTGIASWRQQWKLGLLAPSLSIGWTPTPPSHPPRRTRTPSLPKIYQYTWYWPRITHPMMHLLCGTGCKGARKDLSLAMVSYASNQYFNNISLSNFNPSHSHTLSHPNTYLITTSHLISLSHWHGWLPLAHVSTAKARTPLWS